jgi:hypothetical protein
MKELLARQVLMDGLRQRSDKEAIAKEETAVSKPTPSINDKDKETEAATPSPRFARKLEDLALAVPPPKRVKVRAMKEQAQRLANTPVVICDTISAPGSERPPPPSSLPAYIDFARHHPPQPPPIFWELVQAKPRPPNRHDGRL